MMILGFIGDLWRIFIEWISLFSGIELLVIVVFAVLLYAFADWGMNPKRYENS